MTVSTKATSYLEERGALFQYLPPPPPKVPVLVCYISFYFGFCETIFSCVIAVYFQAELWNDVCFNSDDQVQSQTQFLFVYYFVGREVLFVALIGCINVAN